ncbi:MAG: hypothetical protein CL608_19190 [Anaerolineaceae bacterium]|nr:hypothetical protein [Anaerolineaceae bacterium]
MKNLQKMGGVAALFHAAAYLIGIVMYFAVLSPIIDATTEQYVAQLADYQTTLTLWIFIAYWVSGFCLVVVALALYERLKDGEPALMQLSTVLGIIWAGLIIGSGNLMMHGFAQIAQLYAANPAQAEIAALTVGIVENGIVSANELIGGLWVLLLSWSAWRMGKLSKGLNYLGILIGVSGILTMIPPIAEATQTFFGLSMIVWFGWLGIVLWRNQLSTTTENQNAFIPHHSATN